MSKWIVAGLITLNLLLGGAVAMRMFGDKPAFAQIGTSRSDYAVISGYNNNRSILYLLELSTGKLAVVEVDPINRRVAPISGRDVAADLRRVK